MPGVKPPAPGAHIAPRHRDRDAFNEEGDAQRRAEPRAVGEMSGQQRTDDRANTVEHPIIRASRNALAEPAGDEVNQEHHMRHQRHRVQAVLDA